MVSVDVVVPAYNAVRWIAESVGSVLAQRGVEARPVIVDDGSTDATREVVAHLFPQVPMIQQANRGVSVARNVGLARGSAPYVAFLDADDIWAEDFLARQTALLEDHPELTLSVTDHYQFEDGGAVVLESFLGRHAGFAKVPRTEASGQGAFVLGRLIGEDLVDGMFLWTGALCVRRAAFEASGGFDPALRRAQDHDLWLRLCRSGRAGVILEPLVGRRLHPASISSDELTWAMDEMQIAEKVIRSPDLYPPGAARLLARRARVLWSAGRMAEARGDLRLARRCYLRAWRVGGGPTALLLAMCSWLPTRLRTAIESGFRRFVRTRRSIGE